MRERHDSHEAVGAAAGGGAAAAMPFGLGAPRAATASAAAPPAAPRPPLPLTPATLAAAGLLVAAAVGALIAYEPLLGVAALAGVGFTVLVFVSLPVALGLWVLATFASGLPGLTGLPLAATLLAGMACIGTAAHRRAHWRVALRQSGPLLAAAGLLLAWMAVTLIWAPDLRLGGHQLWMNLTGIVAVPLILFSADRMRTIRLVAAGYVAGAAMVVVLSLVLGPASNLPVADATGRLAVGNFSANLVGGATAAALVLVPPLIAAARGALPRALWLAAAGVLVYGLVGSESRSGLVALAVAALAALAVCHGRRRAIGAGIVAMLALLALFGALQPAAVKRLTGGDSTGRDGLWRVALQMGADHPLGGVGVGNFPVLSKDYSRTVGPLQYVEFLVDEPLVAHNTALEAFADTGIVGLLLLAAVIAGCVRAAWLAARRLGAIGDRAGELLAQMTLVSQAAVLATSMFVSIEYSRQLWVLLALGPALLAIATRARAAGVHEGTRSYP